MKGVLKLIFPLMVFIMGILAGFSVLYKLTNKDSSPTVEELYYTVTYEVGKEGIAIPPEQVPFYERPSLPTPRSIQVKGVGIGWDDLWFEDNEFMSKALNAKSVKSSISDELLFDEYIFLGWYTAAGEVVTSEIFSHNKDITIYAKWRSAYSLYY